MLIKFGHNLIDPEEVVCTRTKMTSAVHGDFYVVFKNGYELPMGRLEGVDIMRLILLLAPVEKK